MPSIEIQGFVPVEFEFGGLTDTEVESNFRSFEECSGSEIRAAIAFELRRARGRIEVADGWARASAAVEPAIRAKVTAALKAIDAAITKLQP
jgi:hypothetical protein